MRVTFQQELEELEHSLQIEGELVLRSLRGAVDALTRQDTELAAEVVAFDDDIDRQYIAIHEGIEQLLARQTPVAVDLHLERAADYCVTIAKLVTLTESLQGDPTLVEELEEMGSRADEMIRFALRSFAERDPVGAEELVLFDEVIDATNRRLVHQVLGLGTDVELREWGLRMILISRCLERIGDHAVDIGEQTAYLVTGEFREFTDASHGDSQGTNGRP